MTIDQAQQYFPDCPYPFQALALAHKYKVDTPLGYAFKASADNIFSYVTGTFLNNLHSFKTSGGMQSVQSANQNAVSAINSLTCRFQSADSVQMLTDLNQIAKLALFASIDIAKSFTIPA